MLIFDDQDYPLLLEILLSIQKKDVITFDLAKLHGDTENYLQKYSFDRSKADWSYAYSGDRKFGPLHHCCGGLGGVYIIDMSLLSLINGFDEKFKGWGEEDNNALDRVMTSGNQYQLRPIKNFAPFHLPHDVDLQSPLYSERF